MQNQPLISGFSDPINVLITGASGGIGLALVEQLMQHDQVRRIIGIARHASSHCELSKIAAAASPRLTLYDEDITDEQSLQRITTQVAGLVSELHLIINATGMLHTDHLDPEKTLSQVTLERLQASFAINAFAPILMAKALIPFVRHHHPVLFVSLSARVGSISDNRLGGWYSYRAAKAAQNQLLKTLSIELTRLNSQSIVLAYHPGTTDTALSKPYQANVPPEKLFSPQFAASSLLQVIAQRSPVDTGKFFAWDGKTIEW